MMKQNISLENLDMVFIMKAPEFIGPKNEDVVYKESCIEMLQGFASI